MAFGTSSTDGAGTIGFSNDDALMCTGDAPWDVLNDSSASHKYTFYDSYDAYVENMRNIGKGYSIVPEYRISERIDDYLDNVEHHKELTRLHDEGCAAYYAEKRANGDNYTGD